LFVSKDEECLTYDGLRLLLERRAKRAKLANKPKLHGFRRAFALNMLRSGVDIFVLQRLMGHADLQVLRRYLAQNDEDKGHTSGRCRTSTRNHQYTYKSKTAHQLEFIKSRQKREW
jgi:integrase